MEAAKQSKDRRNRVRSSSARSVQQRDWSRNIVWFGALKAQIGPTEHGRDTKEQHTLHLRGVGIKELECDNSVKMNQCGYENGLLT